MNKRFHLAYSFRLAHLMSFERDPIKLKQYKRLWTRHLDYYLGAKHG